MTLSAPFKCVGGKAKLVDALVERLPPQPWAGYAEPFLGGGALFRRLAVSGLPSAVWLNDASAGTMRAWQDIQRMPEHTEQLLLKYEMEYNRATPEARERLYYGEREVWNSGGVTGARHIFLRKLGFNGLWRVNRQGKLNVPWGKYASFNAPTLKPLSEALRGVRLTTFPATYLLQEVGPDWVVYLDPPYHGEFAAYTADGFGADQQVALLQAAQAAAARGVRVYYSNRWCPEVRDLLEQHWPEATSDRLVRNQTVACSSTARGAVEELIAWQ